MATTCAFAASVGFLSITRSKKPSLFARWGLPIHAARFIDDSFEKAPHGSGVERPAGDSGDVQQDLLLALVGIDGHAENRLDLADLDGVLRALIEQPHNDLVDAVDGVAEAGELELCVRSIHNKKPLARTGRGSDRLSRSAPLLAGRKMPHVYVK